MWMPLSLGMFVSIFLNVVMVNAFLSTLILAYTMKLCGLFYMFFVIGDVFRR